MVTTFARIWAVRESDELSPCGNTYAVARRDDCTLTAYFFMLWLEWLNARGAFAPAPAEREPPIMRLNPPSMLIFLISIVLALLALVTKLGYVGMPRYLPHQEYWLAITAYMVLMAGTIVRGL